MRLRTRFSLVLAAFALSICAAAVFLTRAVLVRTAVSADEERSRAILARGVNVLMDDTEALVRTLTDWAAGDDTYAFMANRNQDYLEAKLDEGTLATLRLHAILYFDTNRQEAATFALDPDGHKLAHVPAWLLEQALRSDGLLDRLQGKASLAGFLVNGDELWLVAVAPIMTRHDNDPSRGAVLMARHIDNSEMERLTRLVHMSLVLGPAGMGWVPGRTDIRALSPRTMAARTAVADVFGIGRVLLDLTMPRDAFDQISNSLLYLMAWIAVGGIAMMLLSFWILDRWVLRSVTESVATLRAGIVARVSPGGGTGPLKKLFEDEIGELVDAVNDTLVAFETSQTRIRASEARYRALVETLPEAIAGVDQDRRLLFANRALSRLVGVGAADDFTDKPLSEVMSPSFSDAIATRLPDLAKGVSVELGPLAVRASGGDERWILAFLAPVESARDLPAYTLICMRDVTAKLTAEREAEQRRAEAMHAQKLASLGTLVAGVAHEVNNPNGIVNLNMNVMRRLLDRLFAGLKASGAAAKIVGDGGPGGALEAELGAIVEETLAASERIAGLVASLKNFSQPSVNMHTESIEVEALILRSAEWVRHEMSRKQCRLECDQALHGLRVRGCTQQLEQVFINLLHNACDAAGQADMLIRVGASLSPDGRTVTMTLSDEGKGIPQEDLDHVLDPFFTTRRGEGGTGLGLSISSAIVKGHGGTLRVNSAVGKGTVVTVTLPSDREAPHVG